MFLCLWMERNHKQCQWVGVEEINELVVYYSISTVAGQ